MGKCVDYVPTRPVWVKPARESPALLPLIRGSAAILSQVVDCCLPLGPTRPRHHIVPVVDRLEKGKSYLCTHRPSLLPIEWFSKVLGLLPKWHESVVSVCEKTTKLEHLEEAKVVTRFP